MWKAFPRKNFWRCVNHESSASLFPLRVWLFYCSRLYFADCFSAMCLTYSCFKSWSCQCKNGLLFPSWMVLMGLIKLLQCAKSESWCILFIVVSGVQDSHQEKIITVSGEGMVQSPDFPNTYPRNTELVWRLVASSNMRIQLSFDERFGLEDPEDGICK